MATEKEDYATIKRRLLDFSEAKASISEGQLNQITKLIGQGLSLEQASSLRGSIDTVLRFCWRAKNRASKTPREEFGAGVEAIRYLGEAVDLLRFAAIESTAKHAVQWQTAGDMMDRIELARSDLADLLALSMMGQTAIPGTADLSSLAWRPLGAEGYKFWLHRAVALLQVVWSSYTAGPRQKAEFVEFCALVLGGNGLGITRESIIGSMKRHVSGQSWPERA